MVRFVVRCPVAYTVAPAALSVTLWLALRVSTNPVTGTLRNLGLAGTMHYGRISEYEQGKREPSLMTLLAYARTAQVHLEDIVAEGERLCGIGEQERRVSTGEEPGQVEDANAIEGGGHGLVVSSSTI